MLQLQSQRMNTHWRQMRQLKDVSLRDIGDKSSTEADHCPGRL